MLLKEFKQDPGANLDYAFDWSSWLGGGETITNKSVTVTPAAGLTPGTPTVSGGKVTVFLSGGAVGTKYRVACTITTSAARTDVLSCYVSVVNT